MMCAAKKGSWLVWRCRPTGVTLAVLISCKGDEDRVCSGKPDLGRFFE